MKDVVRSYFKWIKQYHFTRFYDLLAAMPAIPVSYRKAILSYSRCQPEHLAGSRFEARLHQELDFPLFLTQAPERDDEEVVYHETSIRSLIKDIDMDPVVSYVCHIPLDNL